MKNLKKVLIVIVTLSCLCVIILSGLAEETDQMFRLGSKIKTNSSFSTSKAFEIKDSDPHYGWDLGSFYVSGYTRHTEVDGKTVFLKNVGDKIELSFKLTQNIDSLNGDESKIIKDMGKGKDIDFEFSENDLGRGVLITQKTNYKNEKEDPVVYVNYLSGISVDANTTINLLEEGDYTVVLDYAVSDGITVAGYSSAWGHQLVPSTDYYKIEINFSIRNGNCMVFPFDVVTKSELTNCAFTENGFSLDLAKSRYLNIDVKKEVLDDTGDNLVTDTRFNKPASDGAQFTEEGIYTITVKNLYTNVSTEKKIYVGTNEILKASATTGKTVAEIKKLVADGATIASDGTLVIEAYEPEPSEIASENSTEETTVVEKITEENTDGKLNRKFLEIGIIRKSKKHENI